MSAQEIHHLPVPEPDAAPVTGADIRSLGVDIEFAVRELTKVVHGIEDELNQWRNGHYVAWKDDPPACHGSASTVAGIEHSTVTHLDEYGRSPIVQVLTESVAAKFRLPDGREVDLLGYAVDTNGDAWPMVRSEKRPRPCVVRDVDQWEEL